MRLEGGRRSAVVLDAGAARPSPSASRSAFHGLSDERLAARGPPAGGGDRPAAHGGRGRAAGRPQHRPLRPADAGRPGRPARPELRADRQRRYPGARPPLPRSGAVHARSAGRGAAPAAPPDPPRRRRRRDHRRPAGLDASSGPGAASGSRRALVAECGAEFEALARQLQRLARPPRRPPARRRCSHACWRSPASASGSPTSRPAARRSTSWSASSRPRTTRPQAPAARSAGCPGARRPGDPGRPARERRAARPGPDDPPGEGAGVRRRVRGRLLGRRPAAPPLDGRPARRGGAAPVLRGADAGPPNAGA